MNNISLIRVPQWWPRCFLSGRIMQSSIKSGRCEADVTSTQKGSCRYCTARDTPSGTAVRSWQFVILYLKVVVMFVASYIPLQTVLCKWRRWRRRNCNSLMLLLVHRKEHKTLCGFTDVRVVRWLLEEQYVFQTIFSMSNRRIMTIFGKFSI